MIHEGTTNWNHQDWIRFRAEYFKDYFEQKDASRGYDITEARREGEEVDLEREYRLRRYMEETRRIGKSEAIKRFNMIFGEAIDRFNEAHKKCA